jgi:hypothetical protein
MSCDRWAPTIHREMGTTEQLVQSWREAADDVGLTVEQVGDAVLVRSFGNPRGMLCAIRQAMA